MKDYTETTKRIVVNDGYAWPTKSGFHGYRLTRYGIVIYECTPFNNELCTIIQFMYGNRVIERKWQAELSQNQITRRVNRLVADVVTNQPTNSRKEEQS